MISKILIFKRVSHLTHPIAGFEFLLVKFIDDIEAFERGVLYIYVLNVWLIRR